MVFSELPLNVVLPVYYCAITVTFLVQVGGVQLNLTKTLIFPKLM